MNELNRIRKYLENLRKNSKSKKRFAVLFSGGIDSALLAYTARGFADAVTINGEFTFKYKLNDAVDFSRRHKIRHKIISLEIVDPEIENSPPNRCYLCKKKIISAARSAGYDIIIDGTNLNDLEETRPGIRALKEEGVIMPLVDLKFGKRQIINAMEGIDSEFSKKPHESCIATRIAEGSKITKGRLERIESAENFIRSLGIDTVRVRDYDDTCEVAVKDDDIKKINENLENITGNLKGLGYGKN